MATDIKICNSALVISGSDENSIQSFDDATREARICSQLYKTTKEALLSKHPWTFALGQVSLARLTAKPEFVYEYAYQLPVSPKLIRVLHTDNKGQDYFIYEDKLYANTDTVKIVYLFDPGEENYPPYFVRALELAMAEMLTLALNQDESLAQLIGRKAYRSYKEARFIDSTNTPPKRIPRTAFPLTNVR